MLHGRLCLPYKKVEKFLSENAREKTNTQENLLPTYIFISSRIKVIVLK